MKQLKATKMSRKHKEEIIRFANSPAGTKVWSKIPTNTLWDATNSPSWDDDLVYIVDDKLAKLRMQFVDDKTQIEWRRGLDEEWVASTLTDLDYFTNRLLWGCYYRIKPKTITKWRWVMENLHSEQLYLTEWSYTEEEAHRVGDRVVCKIEESAEEC